MDIFERAGVLAEALKKSEEFLRYRRCRDAVMEDESERALLSEYRKLRRSAQAAYALGKELDDLTAHKLQKLTEWLQMNERTSELLIAEYRLNRLLGDVYRVLAEAVEIEMDFCEE